MQELLPEEQSKSNIVKFAKTFQIFDQVSPLHISPPKLEIYQHLGTQENACIGVSF